MGGKARTHSVAARARAPFVRVHAVLVAVVLVLVWPEAGDAQGNEVIAGAQIRFGGPGDFCATPEDVPATSIQRLVALPCSAENQAQRFTYNLELQQLMNSNGRCVTVCDVKGHPCVGQYTSGIELRECRSTTASILGVKNLTRAIQSQSFQFACSEIRSNQAKRCLGVLRKRSNPAVSPVPVGDNVYWGTYDQEVATLECDSNALKHNDDRLTPLWGWFTKLSMVARDGSGKTFTKGNSTADNPDWCDDATYDTFKETDGYVGGSETAREVARQVEGAKDAVVTFSLADLLPTRTEDVKEAYTAAARAEATRRATRYIPGIGVIYEEVLKTFMPTDDDASTTMKEDISTYFNALATQLSPRGSGLNTQLTVLETLGDRGATEVTTLRDTLTSLQSMIRDIGARARRLSKMRASDAAAMQSRDGRLRKLHSTVQNGDLLSRHLDETIQLSRKQEEDGRAKILEVERRLQTEWEKSKALGLRLDVQNTTLARMLNMTAGDFPMHEKMNQSVIAKEKVLYERLHTLEATIKTTTLWKPTAPRAQFCYGGSFRAVGDCPKDMQRAKQLCESETTGVPSEAPDLLTNETSPDAFDHGGWPLFNTPGKRITSYLMRVVPEEDGGTFSLELRNSMKATDVGALFDSGDLEIGVRYTLQVCFCNCRGCADMVNCRSATVVARKPVETTAETTAETTSETTA